MRLPSTPTHPSTPAVPQVSSRLRHFYDHQTLSLSYTTTAAPSTPSPGAPCRPELLLPPHNFCDVGDQTPVHTLTANASFCAPVHQVPRSADHQVQRVCPTADTDDTQRHGHPLRVWPFPGLQERRLAFDDSPFLEEEQPAAAAHREPGLCRIQGSGFLPRVDCRGQRVGH